VSKSFGISLYPSSVGTPSGNPSVRNPIVLAVTDVDGSVAVPAGWYKMLIQGNDMYLQMNAATSSSTSPCYPKGYFDAVPVYFGSKAQSGGAAAPALTLHAATVTGSGILSLIPHDPIGSP